MNHRSPLPGLQRQINITGSRQALAAIASVVAGAPASPRPRSAEEVDAARREAAWRAFEKRLALPAEVAS